MSGPMHPALASPLALPLGSPLALPIQTADQLAFHALTYDPVTYEMLGIKTGIGEVGVARASGRYAKNLEGVSYSVGTYAIAWYDGRNVWNELRYSEDFENDVWLKNNNLTVSGNEITFTQLSASLQQYIGEKTFSASQGSAYTYLVLTDKFVDYTGHASYEGCYCIWTARLKAGTTTKCRVRVYFGKNNGPSIFIREDGDYDNDTIFIEQLQLEDVTARTEKTIPSEYNSTDVAVGAELLTLQNAAEIDVDSVEGWESVGCDTFESQSAVADSNYALLARSQLAPTPSARMYRQITGLTEGRKYSIALVARHYGTGGNWRIAIAESDIGGTIQEVAFLSDTNTTFETYIVEFIAGATNYIQCREYSASNGGGAYIDSVSLVEERTNGRAVYGCDNPNTVTDNIVTRGPRIPFSEMPWASGAPAATNSLIRSNDLADAEWSATNVTVGDQDETGVDGLPDTACTLTAAAANGTVIANAITASSDTHATKWYIKRKTGTGTIEVTLDNGSTWQDITSELSSAFDGIAVDQAALTNPQIGIRIVTDTDAVIVANVECHTTKTIGEVRGIPLIPTTDSAVSIQADLLSCDILNHDNDEVCYYFEWMPSYDYDEKITDESILSLLISGGVGLLEDDSTYGLIRTGDGTENSDITGLTYSAGDTIRIGIRASLSGNEMALCVDGVWSAPAAYDGYGITAALQMMISSYEMKMRDLRRYDITGSVVQKERIDSLML